MNNKAGVALVLALVCFAGCDRKAAESAAPAGPSNNKIKELVSRAAGMSAKDFFTIIDAGGAPQAFRDSLPCSLTLELLATAKISADFQIKRPVNPSRLVDALVGGRKPKDQITYASYIRPPYITKLGTTRSTEEISGIANFAVEDCYNGRVDFVLKPLRDGHGWEVTKLAMPSQNLILQRAEDGTWKNTAE